MKRVTMLEYKGYRYLRLGAGLTVLVILAYVIHQPDLGPRGNTALGYSLGGLGAMLTLVLLWYGAVRRRIPVLFERRLTTPVTLPKNANLGERRRNNQPSLRSRASTLQGWFSAHIYLGLALLIIITLHTGFHFGWNIHTLTYVLMVGVIVTGIYGVYAYLRFPRMMTDNLGDDSVSGLLTDIAELDQLALTNALRLPDGMNTIMLLSSRGTRISSNLFEQLRGRPQVCATRAAIDQLQALNIDLDNNQHQVVRDVCSLLLRKESQLKRVRQDLMYRTRLKLWLQLHVPLAFGLLVALAAHVTAVFFFW